MCQRAILAHLTEVGQASAADLREALGMNQRQMTHNLRVLRGAGLVRVCDWVASGPRLPPAPVYGRGDKPDAPRPGRAGRNVSSVPAPGTLPAQALATLRAIPGQTAAALAAELGISAPHAHTLLSHMRKAGLVRIAAWVRECDYSNNKHARPLWKAGPPRNEPPKPPALTAAEKAQRLRARRRPATTTPASVFHLGAIVAQELRA